MPGSLSSSITLQQIDNNQHSNSSLSYLIRLPDELQLRILAQLPIQDILRSAMVCHKWHDLVYCGWLWSTLDVTPFYKSISVEQISKLIESSAKFLRTANFRGCIQLTSHGLRTLSLSCPNIEVLNVKDCRGLSSASIHNFLEHASKLRELDVSGLDTIKTSTLSNIDSVNKLENVNLSWCRNITGHGILSLVQRSSDTLTSLKINGCTQLDQSTMGLLGSCLPRLSYFSLLGCTSLSDASLLEFLQNHHHYHPQQESSPLTHLNLSNCSRLTDSSLMNLAAYAKSLKHLELAGCILMTDHGFSYLSPRVQTLEYLDLEDIHQITDITARTIANHQPKLQRLSLSNCTQISDSDVDYLIKSCQQLQHLELDNCAITDLALYQIAEFLVESSQTPSKDIDWTPRSQPLTIEVLDCTSITEAGVHKALLRAGPILSIKSFYTFQDSHDVEEEEESNHSMVMDNIHRQYRLPGISGRYSTISSARRRGAHHHGVGRTHSTENCIIL